MTPAVQPAPPEPIAELDISRIRLFADEIQLCQADGSIERSIPLSDFDLAGSRRMLDPFGVASLVVAGTLLLIAWYFTTLWIRVPVALVSLPPVLLGIVGVLPMHLVLLKDRQIVLKKSCFESASVVSAFAANVSVALAIARNKRQTAASKLQGSDS
jgi:hypothetical protein